MFLISVVYFSGLPTIVKVSNFLIHSPKRQKIQISGKNRQSYRSISSDTVPHMDQKPALGYQARLVGCSGAYRNIPAIPYCVRDGFKHPASD